MGCLMGFAHPVPDRPSRQASPTQGAARGDLQPQQRGETGANEVSSPGGMVTSARP